MEAFSSIFLIIGCSYLVQASVFQTYAVQTAVTKSPEPVSLIRAKRQWGWGGPGCGMPGCMGPSCGMPGGCMGAGCGMPACGGPGCAGFSTGCSSGAHHSGCGAAQRSTCCKETVIHHKECCSTCASHGASAAGQGCSRFSNGCGCGCTGGPMGGYGGAYPGAAFGTGGWWRKKRASTSLTTRA